jgi:serine/threonine protein kinase
MIAFACGQCGMKFEVKEQFAGRSTHCSTCKHPLIVPARPATVESVPDGPIETTANKGTAGLGVGVTLPTDEPPPGQKPVAELLAQHGGKGPRYLAAGEIARGGMGVVVRAVDCDVRREVALKFMLDGADPHLKVRFVEEAQITGQLEHPNVVPVHELGVDGQGRLFFSMKMIRGRSLAQVLKDLREVPRVYEREWTLGRLLTVFVGTCNGLAYAHSRGVVHRDLKPANVMVGGYGEVYVMDWGLAKVLPQAAPMARLISSPGTAPAAIPLADGSATEHAGPVVTSRDSEADLTQPGTVLGTPAYMAPEQAKGDLRAIDRRTDVHALGALLYEMLTLEPPVGRQGGHAEVLRRVIEGEIVPPAERAPERARQGKVPAELAAIAMKALARYPGARYQSVEEMRRDVEQFSEGRSVSAKQDTTREVVWKLVKRNKATSAAAAVAALLLLCCLTVVARGWWQSRESAREIGLAYDAQQQEQREKDRRTKEAVPAFLRAARLLANDGELADALKQVDLALTYDSDNADARRLRGQVLLAQKDLAGGKAELERYLRQRPGDADTRKAAARAAGKADDPAVLFALAEYLQRQKLHGAAVGLLAEVKRTAENRKALVEIYRKRIEAAWPGLGDRVTVQEDGQIRLNLEACREVTDLRVLKGMQLNQLSLAGGPQVSDLSPLRGMPLAGLNLLRCPVSDLSPLRGMPITWLSLRSCKLVGDLSTLEGMSLTYLDLAECPIHDLGPLRDLPLEYLDVSFGPVQDLKLLRKMPLAILYFVNTRVTDLSPLEGLPLREIWLNPRDITQGWDVLRGIQSLKVVRVVNVLFPAAEFWKKYDAGDFNK